MENVFDGPDFPRLRFGLLAPEVGNRNGENRRKPPKTRENPREFLEKEKGGKYHKTKPTHEHKQDFKLVRSLLVTDHSTGRVHRHLTHNKEERAEQLANKRKPATQQQPPDSKTSPGNTTLTPHSDRKFRPDLVAFGNCANRHIRSVRIKIVHANWVFLCPMLVGVGLVGRCSSAQVQGFTDPMLRMLFKGALSSGRCRGSRTRGRVG